MRQDLPSGTITLLFTDVEGSTKLLHEVGDERYSGILAEHHRLCRQAWQAHRGVEVQTDGDAFFVVFEDAADALMGAQAAQQLLADEPLKVRMGMHTGRVLLKDTGYVGHSVHLAARIASSCHGAQVVLSRATMDQAGHGFVYVDLGEHRLKDIDDPVSIFQLGEGSHPPLKTISNTNLPRMASSFLGRQRELAEVVVLLEQPARLVTLTGPGGTGKSRLALEAAGSVVGSFKGGVFWVALSALREPSLVVATISQTLGAKDDLAQHINEREMLLLLDNLEHVIECAPELSALLLACPHLSMLVTSRELLRVQGEVEYPVPPLTQHEAVALFCERARLEPSDEVGVLCSRLDCLPLAVELAAARTRALSPAQILERLGQRLDLLKGGRDSNPRQQTLRATIEWSHELLSDEEQTLFRRLSVFAGGCTLEAAQTVGGAELDTLQSLVEKSLVRFSAGRFSMLETIRQYATEQLDRADETEQLRSLHAARHTQLAITLADPVRFHSSDSLAELGDEHDNMRVALGFAFERDDVPMASKLLSGLWFYWLITGQGAEAAAWVRRYLASSRESTEPLDRYVGDDAAAEILRFTGQAELARQMKEDLVATGLSHPSAAINGAPIFGATAGALSDLAWMDLTEGRMSQARAHADEALKMRRELGIPGGIGHALTAVAGIAFHEGDYRGALKVFTEATTAFEDIEIDPDSLDSRVMMAQCELLLERADEARALLRDAFPAVIQLADGMLDVLALRVIAMLAAASEQPETSAVLFGGADRMLHDSSVHQFSKHEDMVHESYRGRARAALGDQAFGTAHQRGRETPRDEIMRLAIGSLG